MKWTAVRLCSSKAKAFVGWPGETGLIDVSFASRKEAEDYVQYLNDTVHDSDIYAGRICVVIGLE